MLRGKKSMYYEFSTPNDFLVHIINRLEWKKHHKYECMAIREILEENKRLKRQLYTLTKE